MMGCDFLVNKLVNCAIEPGIIHGDAALREVIAPVKGLGERNDSAGSYLCEV